MTRVRLVVAAAITSVAIVAMAPWPGAPRANAQILPTSTTAPPSSTTTRPKPSTTATTKPSTSTTRRPTTTAPPSTTLTTIAPPSSLVPEEEAPPEIQDQGTVPRFFAVLSGLGFAVAIGMMGTRLYQTRREDEQLAARARERVREILSRRSLRQSTRRPPP